MTHSVSHALRLPRTDRSATQRRCRRCPRASPAWGTSRGVTRASTPVGMWPARVASPTSASVSLLSRQAWARRPSHAGSRVDRRSRSPCSTGSCVWRASGSRWWMRAARPSVPWVRTQCATTPAGGSLPTSTSSRLSTCPPTGGPVGGTTGPSRRGGMPCDRRGTRQSPQGTNAPLTTPPCRSSPLDAAPGWRHARHAGAGRRFQIRCRHAPAPTTAPTTRRARRAAAASVSPRSRAAVGERATLALRVTP